MSQTIKRAVISDFDGTISKVDFFYFAISKLLSENDVQPWLDYKAGRIRHVEALSRIFQKIRLPYDEFINFCLELPIEECFVDTVKYCQKNNIDFYVLSAGADYYINVILDFLKVKDKLKIYSNNSAYSEDGGLIIVPDKNMPFYDEEYGISKKLVVDHLRQNYDYVVFAGDGTPDLEGAKLANKVFARDTLEKLCNKCNLQYTKLNSYCEILEFLRNEQHESMSNE